VPLFSRIPNAAIGGSRRYDYFDRFLGIPFFRSDRDKRALSKKKKRSEIIENLQNFLVVLGIIGRNDVNLETIQNYSANLYYVGLNVAHPENRGWIVNGVASLIHMVTFTNMFYINAVIAAKCFPYSLFRILIEHLKTYELPIYFRVDPRKTDYFNTENKKKTFINSLAMLNFIQYLPPEKDDIQHYFWFPEIEKARRSLIDYLIEAATLS